jgi:hypothetical protein
MLIKHPLPPKHELHGSHRWRCRDCGFEQFGLTYYGPTAPTGMCRVLARLISRYANRERLHIQCLNCSARWVEWVGAINRKPK